MSSMRFLLQKNVWKLTDGELPDKDEIVMLKYCTINLEDGETKVFEREGKFVGFKNGSAHYAISIEEKFGEPSFETFPNNFTKILAWKRIKDVNEDKKEEKDVIVENKTEEIKKDKSVTITRAIIVDKGIVDADVANDLKRWLDTIQFEWGAEVISVIETKVYDAQGFIILYKIDVDEKGNIIEKPLIKE